MLLRTFMELKRGADGGDAEAFRARVTRELQRERRVSRERLDRTVPSAAAVQAVRDRAASIPERQLRRMSFGAGVKRVYKSGLKAFEKARREPTDEHLHEWRKQVKYLFNEIDVVSQLDADHFAKIRKRARRLAEVLGLDHDLAVLGQKILRISRSAGLADDARALRVWSDRVTHRRTALQNKAQKLGRRLYSRRPKRIEAKIEKRL